MLINNVFKDPYKLFLDDPAQRQPDITQAQQHLSWNPGINLDKGSGSTIEYFKHQLTK